MPTLKPRQRSSHVLEHAQTHHGIPLHTKDARNSTSDSARNSRARHPARPSKCTISSSVGARSGTPTPTTIETLHIPMHMRASNTPKGIVGLLCTRKVLVTAAPARQRAQLSGAHTDRSPSKCVISCVTRARSGAPTHTTAETPHARALNKQRRITESLCTQTVCTRNMRHLKTLGRATNLSSTKIHIERHTGREWRIHPHMHRNTPHAYFGPAQTPPWTPLHSKRAHNIRHLCASLAHQNASYRALHRS